MTPLEALGFVVGAVLGGIVGGLLIIALEELFDRGD